MGINVSTYLSHTSSNPFSINNFFGLKESLILSFKPIQGIEQVQVLG